MRINKLEPIYYFWQKIEVQMQNHIHKLGQTILAVFFVVISLSSALANQLLLQSTTSTQNSGLYDYLLPLYQKKTGIFIRVVAVGTGKALLNGQNCNADLLLIHSTADEVKFVDKGFGLYRRDVMYNDFVIVGPQNDPIEIAELTSASQALAKLASQKYSFASRGDDSGTHKKEIQLWQNAGVNPAPFSGSWYLETGSGMGSTLNLAVEKNAYTLTDRGTWIAFGNKQDHKILLEGDTALFNQYGIMPISQKACPNAKQAQAIAFTDWLTSHEGQKAISAFRLQGQPLFIPNAQN